MLKMEWVDRVCNKAKTRLESSRVKHKTKKGCKNDEAATGANRQVKALHHIEKDRQGKVMFPFTETLFTWDGWDRNVGTLQ